MQQGEVQNSQAINPTRKLKYERSLSEQSDRVFNLTLGHIGPAR